MMLENPLHPYYPIDAPINGYTANETPLLELLTLASIGSTVLLGTVFALARYLQPSLTKADRIAILWFFFSGITHCLFEGYFIINHKSMASAQDFFGQLWKEYALSDSRYMTADTMVLCMETMTVLVWGPLCLTVAYSIFCESSLRYPLQLLVCLSHLYGDSLYYATSLYDHYVHERSSCRPEPFYFWVYYFFMNFIWIVVPLYYLLQSAGSIKGAFDRLKAIDSGRKFQ
ncbi:Emopamil-binding protein [Aspergillus avenaceus]|uniref:Emopamil-binding protein n=1 Tax=Aspergillus avenaceus TaxID=36643 RepID=A0A5N6TWV7_ASPAV|nr:Emopamil-binding protein [Aspergillus avenaceus]